MAWVDDDGQTIEQKLEQMPRLVGRIEEARPMPSVSVCTEAERAYLDAVLGSTASHKEIQQLRLRVASERLEPARKAALLRAWADSILASERWHKAMKDMDWGGNEAPLYDVLQKEAEALAESERPK